MKHRVLLVGLGQIGLGYDLDLDRDRFSLTHARAFSSHAGFELVAGVDPRAERRDMFQVRYGAPAYADLVAALRGTAPDVVVIAAPTAEHGSLLALVLAHAKPAAILCEKPLSFDVDEAAAMVAACDAASCRLFVNYMRRSGPAALEVRRRLDDGSIGTPIKGVAWYSKGLFNNGSHFFNLLQYWLGPTQSFQIVDAGRRWDGIDPEPDVYVRFSRGAVIFLAAREENFSHGEIELIAPNGRLRYGRGSGEIVWQRVAADPLVRGYVTLSEEKEAIPSDVFRSQWHVADQLGLALSGREARLCAGVDALATLRTLTEIRDMAWTPAQA